jgi:hypothetical protein
VKILPIVSMTTVRGCESGCSRTPPQAVSERADDGDGRLVAPERTQQVSCQELTVDIARISQQPGETLPWREVEARDAVDGKG